MIKKIFFYCIFVLLLLFSTTIVVATDLPIDINTIGQQERYDSPFMVRFNIDLFSESAQRLNEAIAQQTQDQREELGTSLFEAPLVHQAVDVGAQIATAAYDFALFHQPASFNRIGPIESGNSIPVWLIVLGFIFCAGGGFLVARIMSQKGA